MSTIDTLLKAVRDIAPVVREHAAAADRDCRLVPAAAQAMQKAGLYKLWRPMAFGGFEAEPVAGLQVLEEVSRIDSAAGWNLALSTGIDLFGSWYGDHAAKAIFSPDATLAGSFNPIRKAVPVDGGYRLSGRQTFVSGAHQAKVIFGLANIFDDGVMRVGSNGIPQTLLTAFRAGDAQILENWNTMGMRGTGSHDVNLDNSFIPADWAVDWVPLQKPGRAYEGPLYRLTIWPAVAAIVTAALGIARVAVDEAIDVVTKKIPTYTMKTLKDRSAVQSQLARAEARVRAGRAYLYDTFEEAWTEAVAARPIGVRMKGKMQLAMTHAVLEAAAAVDLIHDVVGASGIREEYPFTKHFRDIHVITQHAFINTSKLESVGQIMLGMDPEWPFFAF